MPDTRATESPPPQVSDGAPLLMGAMENVTAPVAAPAARGRPTTLAVIVAGSPVFTNAFVRMTILEVPLATGCVTEADEGAETTLPR
jgi:hypothetical protein